MSKNNWRVAIERLICALLIIIIALPDTVLAANKQVPEVVVYIKNASSVYGQPLKKLDFTYKVKKGKIKKADLKKMITLKKAAGKDAGKYKITGVVKKASKNKVKVKFVNGTYTIKKATYDMSGVKFQSKTFTYDGEPHGIAIEGKTPKGVKVYYKENVAVEIGKYNAVAIFKGDSKNYKAIPNMYAILEIVEAASPTPDPDPIPDPIPDPTPDPTPEKLTCDMSNVSFPDLTVTYDGQPHVLTINGTLPACIKKVTYFNNTATNAGTYIATVKFEVDLEIYNPIPDMTAKLTIEKATADMSKVSFSNLTVMYDGRPHTLTIKGTLPACVEKVTYLNNTATKVGTYLATAQFRVDNVNYNPIPDMYATLTILEKTPSKLTADMSNVSFPDLTVTYDGQPHVLTINGTLPACVEKVTYLNNTATNAGTYMATVKFEVDLEIYNPIPDMTATLTIGKATYNMSGVSFSGFTLTYDGQPHTAEIVGGLPTGVTVSYENNTITNAGTCVATAKFTGDSVNYNPIPDKTATLTIGKATYDMSGVSFSGFTLTYDGQPHTAEIVGGLPTGVTVSYENNTITNAGTCVATAKFTGDSVNHNPIPDKTATLTIEKATYDMTGITFANLTITYDMTYHTIVISGTLPNGVSVTYTNNSGRATGTYNATATFSGDSVNYNPIPDMHATLTIIEADAETPPESGNPPEGGPGSGNPTT